MPVADQQTEIRSSSASYRAVPSVLVTIAFVGSLLLWLRTQDGLGRLPSDPGYDYFIAASERGWASIWTPDPFPQVVSRFVALCAVQFPVDRHALAAGSITNVLWVGLAVAVGYIVWHQWQSARLAVSIGLLFVLNPVAQESALLNHGNLKWPLLSVALIAISSPTFLRSHSGLISALLILTGVSQPVVFVAVVPIIVVAMLDHNRNTRVIAIVFITVLVCTAYQVLATGLDRSASGHGTSRILRPWPNMGVFWWFGLFGPMIMAVIAIVLSLRGARSGNEGKITVLALSISSIVLGVSSYRLGGIADRYFVTPMFLSSVSAVLVMRSLWNQGARWLQSEIILGFAALLLPSAQWFSVSSWLSSGPKWSEEATRGADICADPDIVSVSMGVTPVGTTEVPCALLHDN